MADARHQYKDHNGIFWNYVSGKELGELYPNGGFKIFSDLGKKGSTETGDILEAEGSRATLSPYRQKQGWLKTVAGYIPAADETGEEGFIRITGTAWYRLLFLILVVLIVCTIFVAGVWFAKKDDVPGLDKTAVSYHIDGVKNTDSESILLPGISVLKVREGETHIKSPLINPDGNGCYFKYIIKLKDTKEILYSSGLIPPGKAVTEFDISRTFKTGKYPITVSVETRDIKEQSIKYNAGNIDAYLEVAK